MTLSASLTTISLTWAVILDTLPCQFSHLQTHIARIGLVTVFIVSGLTPTVGHTTAQSANTNFRGSFEINDPGVANCNNLNGLSGSCLCPGGTAPAYQFRVLNDSAGSGTQHGANVVFCTSGLPGSDNEFVGGYQQDDLTLSGRRCRVHNQVTDECSCPAGTTVIGIRTLVDQSAGIGGSTISLCVKVGRKPTTFGGAYQLDDPVQGGYGCRATNPFIGNCSCPTGFKPQAHRTEVDTTFGAIGSSFFTCVNPSPQVEICPGQFADSTGGSSAAAAIQSCIDNTVQGGTLELPAGNYLIDSQLKITKPIVLRTRGTSDIAEACLGSTPCATFVASPTLYTPGGLLALRSVANVTIDHLILDGNRFERMIRSQAYEKCLTGDNIYGFNAVASKCTTCSVKSSASIRALCGTAFEWLGDDAFIDNNIFSDNGDNAVRRTWSDGLTILQSENAVVTNNKFIDNSDVSLIFGGGRNSRLQNNLIRQQKMRAFAGFMMDNFNGGTSGDFTGAIISGNKIDCAPGNCFFGINIGPHPWYGSANLTGGTVSNNTVIGGTISLNIDGAGTPASPVMLFGNNLGPPRPVVLTGCGQSFSKSIYTARFSASRDSVIESNAEPDIWQEIHGCNGS